MKSVVHFSVGVVIGCALTNILYVHDATYKIPANSNENNFEPTKASDSSDELNVPMNEKLSQLRRDVLDATQEVAALDMKRVVGDIDTTETATSNESSEREGGGGSCKKRPLQIFPLLKELRAGWKNMEVPPLITRNATGTRSLIVDIGLLTGDEFFAAVDNGFEVVGFEPDPHSFPKLNETCVKTPKCIVVDLDEVSLPLKREEGYSYLINAAAGSTTTTMELKSAHESSSLVHMPGLTKSESHQVKVVRVDDFIKEDVYLFKTDTQGFDKSVLEGASGLFKNHVVRQVIVEIDPFAMSHNNVTIHSMLDLLQENGMMCFPVRTDNDKCLYLGESVEGFEKIYDGEPYRNKKWAKCWDDFLCLNVDKVYEGGIPRW